jgi:hypothetical protein
MVGPISPPGMEKSVGRMIHFCIRCAFDVALLLYLREENKIKYKSPRVTLTGVKEYLRKVSGPILNRTAPPHYKTN